MLLFSLQCYTSTSMCKIHFKQSTAHVQLISGNINNTTLLVCEASYADTQCIIYYSYLRITISHVGWNPRHFRTNISKFNVISQLIGIYSAVIHPIAFAQIQVILGQVMCLPKNAVDSKRHRYPRTLCLKCLLFV